MSTPKSSFPRSLSLGIVIAAGSLSGLASVACSSRASGDASVFGPGAEPGSVSVAFDEVEADGTVAQKDGGRTCTQATLTDTCTAFGGAVLKGEDGLYRCQCINIFADPPSLDDRDWALTVLPLGKLFTESACDTTLEALCQVCRPVNGDIQNLPRACIQVTTPTIKVKVR